ncbi:MAG: Fic family protein [Acidimicrobiales bacterium]
MPSSCQRPSQDGDPCCSLRTGVRLGVPAARLRASAFGENAHPEVWSKAAALLQSIVKNHPVVDDNKRLGWFRPPFSSSSTAAEAE